MKKLFIILITSLFIIICGCGSTLREHTVCTLDEQKNVQAFINSNIKDANNYSDEEMEDVISQLEKTGTKICCHQELIWIWEGNGSINWEKQKYDSNKIIY